MTGLIKKYHPLTGALLVPLGTRKNGRIIWPIMGGDDSVPPADAPPADAPPADVPPKDADTPPTDDGKGGKSAILADLAAERDKRQALEQQVNDLKTAQQSLTENIAKAFGIQTDADTPPDPAELTKQLTAEQTRAREAAVQLAVYRNAAANGANPDALLDSASFLRSLGDVDPADTAAVTAAIKAAIEANPLLKAGDNFPTPGQAGIGVAGGGAQPTDPRAADLAQIEADLATAKRR